MLERVWEITIEENKISRRQHLTMQTLPCSRNRSDWNCVLTKTYWMLQVESVL